MPFICCLQLCWIVGIVCGLMAEKYIVWFRYQCMLLLIFVGSLSAWNLVFNRWMQVDDERIIYKVELFICIVCLMHVDEEAIVC